jgi:hypothetical protein
VVDAGAGNGAIADELPYPRQRIVCVENEPTKVQALLTKGYHVEREHGGDWLAYPWRDVDVVVMNPPFINAIPFIMKGLECIGEHGMLTALLRVNFLGTKKRASFHRAHPSHILVLPKRPSFTGNGSTDATEYAWFFWGKNPGAERPIMPGTWQIADVGEVAP